MPLSLKPLEFLNQKEKNINIWARLKKEKRSLCNLHWGWWLWFRLPLGWVKRKKKCKNTDAYVVALRDSDSGWDNL